MFETEIGQDFGLHRNSIFFFNESTYKTDPALCGCISNIIIANNFISMGYHPLSTTAGSGAMFFDAYTSTAWRHVRVFNNVSTLPYPLSYSGGGGPIAAGGVDVLEANNTSISGQTNGVYDGGGIGGQGVQLYVYNNINIAQNTITLGTFTNTTGLTADDATVGSILKAAQIYSDYNIYNGQAGYANWVFVIFGNGGSLFHEGLLDSYNQWTNVVPGQWDNHSSLDTVQLASNFAPLSTDTVAIGHGTNLTAFAIADNLPQLTNDFAGNPRPATGPWTIGAYQVGSANSTSATSGDDITNGLLLRYLFNEGSGTNAYDSSGNGYTGVLQGNAGWGNRTVVFPSNDGSYASPNCVASSTLTYSGDWTITFWVYLNYSPGVANYAVSTATGTGIAVGPAGWGFYDGATFLRGPSTLNAHQWYHVAVSKSAGTNYQLYLNGNPGSAGALSNITVSALNIGNRGGALLGMNGRMEDFRIFNRVLSAGEIATLNANGPVGATNSVPTTMPPSDLQGKAPAP